jgi:hypothetical protein
VQGQDFEILYDQWIQSDFFKRFALKQIGERVVDDHVEPVFAPGAFKQSIALQVESRPKGTIRHASLDLERTWILGNFAMALDIAKRFVRCFAPAPDQTKYAGIASALDSLRDPRNLIKAKETDPNESDEARCVHAFMGSVERADVTTDFAHLSIGSVLQGDRQFQHLSFDLL